MRVGLIQLNSRQDRSANVNAALLEVDRAAQRGADLAMTPECTDYKGDAAGAREAAAEVPGVVTEAFAARAREHSMWVLLGSVKERAGDGSIYNTSVLLDRQGEVAALYRKVHLFDVRLPNGDTRRESDAVAPGGRAVVADVEGGGLGLSVCYDLRFPELYRALVSAGARMLAVPAAFTFVTGRDHWEVLLRARAIENQCWVIAPGQVGSHGTFGRSNGRSMAIDPWGVVTACASDAPGLMMAEVDLDLVDRVRKEFPALEHRRPDVYARPADVPSLADG